MARSKQEYENALIWLEEANWAKSEHYHSNREVNKRIKLKEQQRYEEFIKPFEREGIKWRFVEDTPEKRIYYPPIVIEYDGQHPADKIFE